MWNYETIFSVAGHIWGVVAALLLVAAVILIRYDKERFEGCHKWMMVTMVGGGWAFVLFYLSGRFLRSVPLNIPVSLVPWFAIHGAVAVVTLLGSTLLLLTRTTEKAVLAGNIGFKAKLNLHHRLLGIIFVLLWLFTHFGGIFNLHIIR